MYIDDVRRTDSVTTSPVINEASDWGMSRRRAGEIAETFFERVPAAGDRAVAETPGLPDEILATLNAQFRRLQSPEI